MARTPTYEQTVITQPSGVPAPSEGWAAIASQWSQFAKTTMGLRQNYADQDATAEGAVAGATLDQPAPGRALSQTGEAYNKAFLSARQGQLQVQVKQQTQELQDNLMNNPSPDNLKKYQAGVQGMMEGLSKSVPPELMPEMKQYVDYTAMQGAHAIGTQTADLAKNQMIGEFYDYQSNMTDQMNQAAQKGDFDAAHAFAAQQTTKAKQMLDSGMITGIQYHSIEENITSNVQDAVQSHNIEQAISGGKMPELLKHIEVDPHLTDDQKKRYTSQALGALRDHRTVIEMEGFNVDQQEQNAIEYVRNTGDTKAVQDKISTVVAYYPEKASEFRQELSLAQDQNTLVKSTMYATPDEASTILKAYEPKPDDPAYANKMELIDRVQKTYVQTQKQLRTDPVSVLQKDPAYTQAVEAAKTDASVNPNEVLIKRQQDLGVGQSNLSLISGTEAKAQVTQIMAMPYQKQAEAVMGLSQQYGQYSYVAMRDLKKAGLPIASQLYVGMGANNQQYMPEVAVALSSDKPPANIDTQTNADIKSSVNNALQPYFDSTKGYNSLPVGEMNGVISTAQRYAQYLVGAKGMSASDAANQAANVLINNNYSYFNYNGATVRVPVGIDPDNVKDASSTLMRQAVQPDNIVLPRNYQDKTQYMQDIQSNGFFITTPDNQGIMLVASNGSPVMQMVDGKPKPIMATFADINSPNSKLNSKPTFTQQEQQDNRSQVQAMIPQNMFR